MRSEFGIEIIDGARENILTEAVVRLEPLQYLGLDDALHVRTGVGRHLEQFVIGKDR